MKKTLLSIVLVTTACGGASSTPTKATAAKPSTAPSTAPSVAATTAPKAAAPAKPTAADCNAAQTVLEAKDGGNVADIRAAAKAVPSLSAQFTALADSMDKQDADAYLDARGNLVATCRKAGHDIPGF